MPDEEAWREFWDAAATALRSPGVATGTMMGFPCLRAQGVFFAAAERRTGDLIVRLPAARVQALLGDGEAIAFAPNGRTFREWARVPQRDREGWAQLIGEALSYARSSS
jgi:hypothetical protein